jgi:hypothetical protein
LECYERLRGDEPCLGFWRGEHHDDREVGNMLGS